MRVGERGDQPTTVVPDDAVGFAGSIVTVVV
jgi:hypothetical protein